MVGVANNFAYLPSFNENEKKNQNIYNLTNKEGGTHIFS